MFVFVKEMNFDEKYLGNKGNGEKSLIRLSKSPAIMKGSLENKSFSITRWLPPDPNEVPDRLKILLQEKQAGKVSNKFNEVFIAIADKLLQYECMSTKQHSNLVKVFLETILNLGCSRSEVSCSLTWIVFWILKDPNEIRYCSSVEAADISQQVQANTFCKTKECFYLNVWTELKVLSRFKYPKTWFFSIFAFKDIYNKIY